MHVFLKNPKKSQKWYKSIFKKILKRPKKWYLYSVLFYSQKSRELGIKLYVYIQEILD